MSQLWGLGVWGMIDGRWVRVGGRVGIRMGEDESGVVCVFGVNVVRWKEGGTRNPPWFSG